MRDKVIWVMIGAIIIIVSVHIWGVSHMHGITMAEKLLLISMGIIGTSAIVGYFFKEKNRIDSEHENFMSTLEKMKQENGGQLSNKQAYILLANLPPL